MEDTREQTTAPTGAADVIRGVGVAREFAMGTEVVHALHPLDLVVPRNHYLAIMGPSGSGKTTLMNILGCLDTASQGEYWLNGVNVSEMTDTELAHVRNREIGFCLPDVQSPRARDCAPQRRAAAPLRGGGWPRAQRARDGRARTRGTWRPPAAPAERVVGRPAPTSRHRARAGVAAGAPPGGRAHRESGQPHGRRSAGPVRPGSRRGSDHRRRHARRRHRRARPAPTDTA